SVDMSQLDGNSDTVRVEAIVSNRGVLSENPSHHLKITINGTDFDSTIFRSDVPVSLIYDIPISYFVSGNNTIMLTVLGDQVAPSDYDMLDLESVKVSFERNNLRTGTQTTFTGGDAGAKFTAWGYGTSDVSVFDVSSTRNVFEYGQVFTDSFDGGSNYQVSFKNLFGPYGEGGNQKIIVEGNNFKSFDSRILGRGVENLMKDSSNNFEHIVITDTPGLNAAKRLAEYRTGQGMKSVAVTLEQIYGEFSHGRKNALAINKFINYALQNWSTSPKFVLIMGDTSFDPKDDLEWAGEYMHPVLLYKGSQNDYGSDAALGLTNLGTDEESNTPAVAIGRLPTNNPFKLESYVEKVIAYESGTRAPLAKAKSSIFIIGEADENEDFTTPSNDLAGTLIAANRDFEASFINRNLLADDTEANTAVTEAFGEGTLFVTYMGHGAEDLWGLGGFFETTDAEELTNNELPIVLGLGCLNSYYYDADTEWYSLAEELVLNPNGGAIAFWGSTTVTSPQAQLKLATNAFNEIGQRSKTYDRNARIGEMMLAAQSAMGRNIIERDMSMSWTLFGDPALKLPEQAFSEQAPAPSTAAPLPPAPIADEFDEGGVFGCSLGASAGSGPGTVWDFFLFLVEIVSSVGIYRFGRKKFKK
ncbi:MAG: C25 family cysteine peptidase, partial [Halobacteriovoraceae bacterium]|nr:C25 family cysteine peptidase [Halobacteriovoraceae bacterium]